MFRMAVPLSCVNLLLIVIISFHDLSGIWDACGSEDLLSQGHLRCLSVPILQVGSIAFFCLVLLVGVDRCNCKRIYGVYLFHMCRPPCFFFFSNTTHRGMRRFLRQLYSLSFSTLKCPLEYYIASVVDLVPFPLHGTRVAAIVCFFNCVYNCFYGWAIWRGLPDKVDCCHESWVNLYSLFLTLCLFCSFQYRRSSFPCNTGRGADLVYFQADGAYWV